MLGGEVSSRAANAVRSIAKWCVTRGRSQRSNALGRARTPSLVPRLGPNGPGTGPPSLVVGRHGRRPSRCPRARSDPSRRSNVAIPANPPLRSNRSLRARARRRTARATRSRTKPHRVCRLLAELPPRLAQSSAKRSDRPAAAEGRVCWSASPDPRACAARTIAGLVGVVVPDSTT